MNKAPPRRLRLRLGLLPLSLIVPLSLSDAPSKISFVHSTHLHSQPRPRIIPPSFPPSLSLPRTLARKPPKPLMQSRHIFLVSLATQSNSNPPSLPSCLPSFPYRALLPANRPNRSCNAATFFLVSLATLILLNRAAGVINAKNFNGAVCPSILLSCNGDNLKA